MNFKMITSNTIQQNLPIFGRHTRPAHVSSLFQHFNIVLCQAVFHGVHAAVRHSCRKKEAYSICYIFILAIGNANEWKISVLIDLNSIRNLGYFACVFIKMRVEHEQCVLSMLFDYKLFTDL